MKRDLDILQKVTSFGILSTTELADLFFQGIARTTVLKRLRILEGKKFIKRVKGLENAELLWSIDQKGAKLIDKEFFKTSWDKKTIDHDLLISKIRLAFEKVKLYESWIPEHEIKSRLSQKLSFKEAIKKLIPDGIMNVKLNNKIESMAIEVELSHKNKNRYERIFREYGRKENLFGVWYFVRSEAIFKMLMSDANKYSYELKGKKLFVSFADEILKDISKARIFTFKEYFLIKEMFPNIINSLAQELAHPMSNQNFKSCDNEHDSSLLNHTSFMVSSQ